MAFELPPLPFDRTAIEPHISAGTFDFHHGKHHKAYVDKVNGWIEEKGLAGRSLVEVVRLAREKGDKGLFNNAAQVWNHTFFWNCLAPTGTRPSAKLQGLIESGFGSTANLLKALQDEAVSHFASGWAWLVLEGDKLKVTSYHDADTPILHEGVKPLFTLDVWEHAYYIDYRNARPKFAEAVLENAVNWDFVSENLDGRGEARADQEQKELAEA
jgi:Fe-Mn family superoxide dismutase